MLRSVLSSLRIWEGTFRHLCASTSATPETSTDKPPQSYLDSAQLLLQGNELDAEQKKRLKQCMEEYELARYVDPKMPEKVKKRSWLRLIDLKSEKQRMHHFLFLKDIEWKEQKQKEAKKRRLSMDNRPSYNYSRSIMIPLRESRMKHELHSFGSVHPLATSQPTVVLDMSYFEQVDALRNSRTAMQINRAYEVNYASRYPCKLILSNIPMQSRYIREHIDTTLLLLKDRIATPEQVLSGSSSRSSSASGNGAMESSNLEKVDGSREKSVNAAGSVLPTVGRLEDMFPREKIVMITQRARKPLLSLEEDKIYVIPAMIDHADAPVSPMARGKQLQVDHRYIPYDRFLEWRKGHKRLPLNLILSILLDVFNDGDWEAAMKEHVPKRKMHSHKPVAALTNARKRNHLDWMVSEISGRQSK